jgi:hypothetical protein
MGFHHHRPVTIVDGNEAFTPADGGWRLVGSLLRRGASLKRRVRSGPGRTWPPCCPMRGRRRTARCGDRRVDGNRWPRLLLWWRGVVGRARWINHRPLLKLSQAGRWSLPAPSLATRLTPRPPAGALEKMLPVRKVLDRPAPAETPPTKVVVGFCPSGGRLPPRATANPGAVPTGRRSRENSKHSCTSSLAGSRTGTGSGLWRCGVRGEAHPRHRLALPKSSRPVRPDDLTPSTMSARPRVP